MALVAGREKIQPADVDGRFRRARRAVGVLLILFFVGAPWVRILGLPAVLIDIPGRRLILAGLIFTPHDTWALALLLLAAAMSLFLFTAALGRIWCGWACPQTVWLDWVYRPIERWVEGPSHRRVRRDAGPRTWDWWRRKIAKHALFVVVTAVTTGIFLTWFVGGPELVRGELGSMGLTLGGLLFTVFYLDASWFREQLCNFACPYARFQGALMDTRSLVVAYDAHRGEPRRVGKTPVGGDCIDCNRCAAVCPNGIDIREGDQLSCIACASCVDACDEIMVNLGRPPGLVRFTTRRDAPASPGEARPVVTARGAMYLLLLLGVVVTLVVGLATRPEVVVAVARAGAGELYQVLPDGRIANKFTVHINNRDRVDHTFDVVSASQGVDVAIAGLPWPVGWGDHARLVGFVIGPPDEFMAGRRPVVLAVQREDGVRVEASISLLGPGAGAAPSRTVSALQPEVQP